MPSGTTTPDTQYDPALEDVDSLGRRMQEVRDFSAAISMVLTPTRVNTQKEANEVCSHRAIRIERSVRNDLIHGPRLNGMRVPAVLLVLPDHERSFTFFASVRGFSLVRGDMVTAPPVDETDYRGDRPLTLQRSGAFSAPKPWR